MRPSSIRSSFLILCLMSAGFSALSCGVKAPPLPPAAETPQKSDYKQSTQTPLLRRRAQVLPLAMSKPQDYFHYESGWLSSDGIGLKELAEKYGTPLYVYSERAFVEPFEKLQKALVENFQICFA